MRPQTCLDVQRDLMSNTRPSGSSHPVMNLMMDIDSAMDVLRHLEDETTAGKEDDAVVVVVDRIGDAPTLLVGGRS